MFRSLKAAPRGGVEKRRRGKVVGKFCHGCGSIYSRYSSVHHGKPLSGKDHVSSPCAHEGDAFEAGAEWWEPAVAVLPPPESTDGE